MISIIIGSRMGNPYTKQELEVIQFLARKYGFISYQNPANLEEEYFARTGTYRSHGCIYMAYWRLCHGYYDTVLSA